MYVYNPEINIDWLIKEGLKNARRSLAQKRVIPDNEKWPKREYNKIV